MLNLPVGDVGLSVEQTHSARSSDRSARQGTIQSTAGLIFAAIVACFGGATGVRADGGLARWAERVGNYRITVFTSPTPFRAGPVEIGVLPRDAESNDELADTTVTIEVSSRQRPRDTQRRRADSGKLIPSANFDLPDGGWWRIRVILSGRRGHAETSFELEADDPVPPWRELSFWIFLPVIPIAFFAVHQWLVRRRDQGAP